MAINFDNVSLTYEHNQLWEKRALHNVDLHIEKGEILGIIGPTGSGKSTLLQLMNGILMPTGGRVLVEGDDTRQLKGRNLTRLRQMVGLVFQFPEDQLFEKNIYHDIAFGPRSLGLARHETEQRVRWAMDAMDLSFEESQRSPFAMSGGQRRRAAIAGVLAMKPHYLVLDEPSAGLDPLNRKLLLSMIQQLRNREGTGIVLVSHQMRDIFETCDRVAVLKDGCIIADDRPETVLDQRSMLESCGLLLPPANQLLHALKDPFPWVNTRIVSIPEAAQEVAKLLGDGR